MTDLELQARLVVLRDGRVVRNETVVDSGQDRAALARRGWQLASEGFTAWLFRLTAFGATARPTWRLLQTFHPPLVGLGVKPRSPGLTPNPTTTPTPGARHHHTPDDPATTSGRR